MQPYRFKYWITTKKDKEYIKRRDDVCYIYSIAKDLHDKKERVISIDEMTGIQALERKHEGKNMKKSLS